MNAIWASIIHRGTRIDGKIDIAILHSRGNYFYGIVPLINGTTEPLNHIPATELQIADEAKPLYDQNAIRKSCGAEFHLFAVF